MRSIRMRALGVSLLLLLGACATEQHAPVTTGAAGVQGQQAAAPATHTLSQSNTARILSIGDASVIDPGYPVRRGWQYTRIVAGDSLAEGRYETAVAPNSLALDVGDLVQVQPQSSGAILITQVLKHSETSSDGATSPASEDAAQQGPTQADSAP